MATRKRPANLSREMTLARAALVKAARRLRIAQQHEKAAFRDLVRAQHRVAQAAQ